MTCKDMLKNTFAHAKKGVIKGGEFPIVHAVYVTATLHETNDAPEKTHDIVWYGNGVLKLIKKKDVELKKDVEFLSGNIHAWINNVKMIDVKTKPGEISLPLADLFPFTAHTTLKVEVSESGKVSVQKLINNKAFLGRPPVEFQATCTNGLLTAVVSNTSYTLSFTHGQEQLG